MANTEIDQILSRLDIIQFKPGQSKRCNEYCSYSILGGISVEEKMELVEASKRDLIVDRMMGSMCGMAIGDAVGAPLEFLPCTDSRSTTSYFSRKEMSYHGIEKANSFNMKPGQWTDDSSMGLCIADSLIVKQTLDGVDVRIRYWHWYNNGYNNSFRKDEGRTGSIGCGDNVRKSLMKMSNGQEPSPYYKAENDDSGNGCVIRLTPVALFYHAFPTEVLHEKARESSRTSHPGVAAAEASSFLAHLINYALTYTSDKVDPKAFLDEATKNYLEVSDLTKKSGKGYDDIRALVLGKPPSAKERCWEWRSESLDLNATLAARGGTYNGYPVSKGYFGSYALDGLAVAIWAVYNTDNFGEAIERSVNILGDADSVSAITGQLAGALYGYSGIDPPFLHWLNNWDDHEFAVRAVLLHKLGRRAAEGEPAYVYKESTRTSQAEHSEAVAGNPAAVAVANGDVEATVAEVEAEGEPQESSHHQQVVEEALPGLEQVAEGRQQVVEQAAVAPVGAEGIAAAPPSAATLEFLTLDELRNPSVWKAKGIAPNEREQALSAADFQALFAMDKDAFAKVPKWKQEKLKKEKGLY